MILQAVRERGTIVCRALAATLIAARSCVASLPLLVSPRPGTPLRVLCIMAFDMLHRLHRGQPMPKARLRVLAAMLDLGACANAELDDKRCRPREYCAALQLLEEGSLRVPVAEYLRRLRTLEHGRPQPGGEDWAFQNARAYREAVVRLSLGMAATIATGTLSLDDAIRATFVDADLNLLFRIVMQCQIIDDVLDYEQDLPAGLPGFLTSCRLLSQGLELTRLAALDFADDCDLPRKGDQFPLRVALVVVTSLARLVIVICRWSHRVPMKWGATNPTPDLTPAHRLG
jgi:hypothetical protein